MRYVVALALALSLQACVTRDSVTYSCIRGVVFVHSSAGGLAWLPDKHGEPVSCIDFGGAEVEVPEEIVPN